MLDASQQDRQGGVRLGPPRQTPCAGRGAAATASPSRSEYPAGGAIEPASGPGRRAHPGSPLSLPRPGRPYVHLATHRPPRAPQLHSAAQARPQTPPGRPHQHCSQGPLGRWRQVQPEIGLLSTSPPRNPDVVTSLETLTCSHPARGNWEGTGRNQYYLVDFEAKHMF